MGFIVYWVYGLFLGILDLEFGTWVSNIGELLMCDAVKLVV